MDWQRLCSMLQSEDPRRTEAQIYIHLGNGLTISGPMDFEAAKAIFREPGNPSTVLEGSVAGQMTVVVLPAATIQSVAFPYQPPSDQGG